VIDPCSVQIAAPKIELRGIFALLQSKAVRDLNSASSNAIQNANNMENADTVRERDDIHLRHVAITTAVSVRSVAIANATCPNAALMVDDENQP